MELFKLFGSIILNDNNVTTKLNQVKNSADNASKGLDGVTNKSSRLGTIFNTAGSLANLGLKGILTGVGAVSTALGGALTMGVKYNSQMEQYLASFTTMLGSQVAATQHIDDLKKFAAETPFELSDLAGASQMLQAFGRDVKFIQGDIKTLGDISQGNQEKFKGLALVFGQVQSQGRLMGQDLLQMINQGFNPLQIISEKTGKSMATLKEDMEKGKISFEMVADAMKTATSEGGKFYNAMENQSKTQAGLFSTLKDNANALLSKVFMPISESIRTVLIPQALGYIDKLNTEFDKKGAKGLANSFGNMLAELTTKGAEYAPKIIDLAFSIIKSFVEGINNNLPAIMMAGKNILFALINGISGAFPFLTPFANVIKFIIDNLNSLIPVIVGVGLAFATFSIVMTVIGWLQALSNTFTIATAVMALYDAGAKIATVTQLGLGSGATILGTVMAVLTGKLSLATLGTQALTAAMTFLQSSTGIGLVITAIALLGAGIVAYTNATNSSAKATKAKISELQNLNKTLEENKQKVDDVSIANDASASKVLVLRDKLIALNQELKQSNITTEEATGKKNDLKNIVAELNRISPEFQFKINKETGLLETQSGEVISLTQAYIQLALAKAKAAAVETAITEAQATKIKAQKVLDDNVGNEKIDTLPWLPNKFKEILKPYTGNVIIDNPAITEANNTIAKANNDLQYYTNILTGALDDVAKNTPKATDKNKDFAGSLNGVASSAAGASKSVKDASDKVDSASEKTKEASEKQKTAIDIISDSLKVLDYQLEQSQNAYELWELQNSDTATTVEKTNKILELNKIKQENLSEKIRLTNVALSEAKKEYGSASSEVASYEAEISALEVSEAKLNLEMSKKTTIIEAIKNAFSTLQTSANLNLELLKSKLNLFTKSLEYNSNGSASATSEMTKLDETNKSLNEQISEQQIKIDGLNNEYMNMVTAVGATSAEAKKLLIDLNNEKAALIDLQAELKKTNALRGTADDTAKKDFVYYYSEGQKWLKQSGYTNEQIKDWAAKLAGDDPSKYDVPKDDPEPKDEPDPQSDKPASSGFTQNITINGVKDVWDTTQGIKNANRELGLLYNFN